MRALGYCRVSTEEQGREGLSLGVQRARLQAYCMARGLAMQKIYEDVKTAKNMTGRPALLGLLDDVRRGDVIVCCKLDRIFRNTKDALEMMETFGKAGIELASIEESIDTSTPHGKFFFTLIAALATLEREQTAERTRRVIGALKDSGRKYGPPPFGKRAVGGDLRTDLGAERAIAEIRYLHGTGATLRGIASWLQENGPPPPRGKGRWHASTVRLLLRRDDGRAEGVPRVD